MDPVFLPKLEKRPNQALLNAQGHQVLQPLDKAFFPQGEAPKRFLQKLGMLPKEKKNSVSIEKANAAVIEGLGGKGMGAEDRGIEEVSRLSEPEDEPLPLGSAQEELRPTPAEDVPS